MVFIVFSDMKSHFRTFRFSRPLHSGADLQTLVSFFIRSQCGSTFLYHFFIQKADCAALPFFFSAGSISTNPDLYKIYIKGIKVFQDGAADPDLKKTDNESKGRSPSGNLPLVIFREILVDFHPFIYVLFSTDGDQFPRPAVRNHSSRPECSFPARAAPQFPASSLWLSALHRKAESLHPAADPEA